MNVFKKIKAIIHHLMTIHKEGNMLSYEALSSKDKYMGMGIIAITHNKVDYMFIIMVLVLIVYPTMRNEVRTRRALTNKRACMKRAMHDYSYSSAVVRMLDKEG